MSETPAAAMSSGTGAAPGIVRIDLEHDDLAGDALARFKRSSSTPLRRRRGPRSSLRRYLASLEFQIFMMLVIMCDVFAFAAELWCYKPEEDGFYSTVFWVFFSINIATISIYVAEIVLKLIAFGPRNFFRDSWNVFDLIVVAISAVLVEGPGGTVIAARLSKIAKNLKFLKILGRLTRSMRVASRLNPITKAVKSTEPSAKLRYIDLEDNFDLELAYISAELIAMGAPATNCLYSFSGNPLGEVARFFRTRHADHFRIYNACPEVRYPDGPFEDAGGKVVRLQIQGGTPPTMPQFLQFLSDAREWRKASMENVLAVHCKACMGRTGSLCSAWLVYSYRPKSAQEALEMLSKRRSGKRMSRQRRCVETPSQIRAVQQLFAHLQRSNSWLSSPAPPPPCATPTIALHSLGLGEQLLAKARKTRQVKALVQCGGDTASDVVLETKAFAPTAQSLALGGVLVQGDVRVSVFEDKGPDFSASDAMLAATNADEAVGLIFFFIFHTAFMTLGQDAKAAGHTTGDQRTFRVAAEALDMGPRAAARLSHIEDSCVLLHYSNGGTIGGLVYEWNRSRLLTSSEESRASETSHKDGDVKRI